jgi:two-component system, LytTR family, sensor kinase
VTEARDLPNIRRVFVATLAAFTAIGVLRGTVALFIDPGLWQQAWYLYRIRIAISWFWIPVALAVAALWPWRRLRRRFLAAHATLLAFVIFGEVAWMTFVFHALASRTRIAPYSVRLIGRFDTNLLMYAAIVGAIWAAESVRRDNATRLAAAKLDSLLADTRLYVLTLQLHPHFLFNTLNLISQLAYRDVEAARRTLGHLRALLVQSLTHAGSRAVPLREELRFLGSYLEIQHRRRHRGDGCRGAAPVAAAAR